MVVFDEGLQGSAPVNVFNYPLEYLLIFDMAKGFGLRREPWGFGVWARQPVWKRLITGDNRAYRLRVSLLHSAVDVSTVVKFVEYKD